MIELTKLNKKKFYLNCELIETVESTPDTVITLRNGKLLIAEEPPSEIARMVLDYKKNQFSDVMSGVLFNNLPEIEVTREGMEE